jgi:hypothetical protein
MESIECNKCAEHAQALCWDHAVTRGLPRMIEAMGTDLYLKVLGTRGAAVGSGVLRGRKSNKPSGTVGNTVERVARGYSGIDAADIVDRVSDVIAAWIGRADPKGCNCAPTCPTAHRWELLANESWISGRAIRWAHHAAQRASTGRGSIQLSKPTPPAPLPIRVPRVIAYDTDGPATIVTWTPRAATESEIGALDKGGHLRQERTAFFSSWTSPDGAVNPPAASHNARPIAQGGLVNLYPRWSYRDGGTLSREDKALLDLAVDAVRGGWSKRADGSPVWKARFLWSDSIGRELSRAESMVLRRAIAKLVPMVELHYTTARAEIDLGAVGVGSGVPAPRPMVRLSDPTDNQLIVPTEIGTRELDDVLPTGYVRSRKSRLQVAANRAAYLLDKADIESALLTYRL